MPRASVMFVAVLLMTTAAAVARRMVRRPVHSPAHVSLASSPAQTVPVTCPSPALDGGLPALVYLPAGYETTPRRYPVIYVLHGLPAGPQTYTASGFVASAVGRGAPPAIVVSPQGARTPNSDPEYLDDGSAQDWPRAIAHDLTRCIDSRFRTIAKRSGRALVGFSAGGFGAMNIGLRNLGTYAAVEAWSGYFEATDPTGEHVLELGSAAADAAAQAPRGAPLARALRHRPTFIGFYIGNQDSYQNFLADNRAFDASLRAARVRHTFAVYPGGHSVSLWEQHAPAWLGRALSFLANLRAER